MSCVFVDKVLCQAVSQSNGWADKNYRVKRVPPILEVLVISGTYSTLACAPSISLWLERFSGGFALSICLEEGVYATARILL